jgi:CDP-diacylglycerol--serine O-phosphatidyltransferase
MFAGICDLFDGTIARKCKRTEKEKLYGIELDSLIDVFDFIAFPVVICLKLVDFKLYYIPVLILYSIFGIARLAFFNIDTASPDGPIKYYLGLPVTYVALIFPLCFVISFFNKNIFDIIYIIAMLVVGILFILKLNVPKPKLIGSIGLLLLAIVLTILFILI